MVEGADSAPNHVTPGEQSSDDSSVGKDDGSAAILRRASNHSGSSPQNGRSEEKPSFSSVVDRRDRKGLIPLFFERASGNIFNPSFDSETLEVEFQRFSVSIDRRLFQIALLFMAFSCVSLTVFFGISHRDDHYHLYLTIGCAVGGLVSGVIFLLSKFQVIYNKPWEARVLSALFSVSYTAAEVISFFVVPERNFAYSARFIIATCIILLLYTTLPALPLYGNMIITILFSISHELAASFRAERSRSSREILGMVFLHICIHTFGLTIAFMAHVRKRSTFWRVGQSIVAKQDLEIEHRVKERMIRSVMPKAVADFLVEDGMKQKSDDASKQQKVAFRPFNVHRLENVSILFADIVGFTKMSANKKAETLVNLLNILFGKFDELTIVNNNEKISTLGDCYYCVSGCPENNPDHAIASVEMALDVVESIKKFREETGEEVDMRVGIHTGVVLCGIIGDRRRRFDVWSNDVTLANKMEARGMPGRVHVSEVTYSFLKDMYDVADGPGIKRPNEDGGAPLKTYFITGRKFPVEEYKTWFRNARAQEKLGNSTVSLHEPANCHSGSLSNIIESLVPVTQKKIKHDQKCKSPLRTKDVAVSITPPERSSVIADEIVEIDYLAKAATSPPISPAGASHIQKHLVKTPLPFPRLSATFNFTYGMTLNEALMRDAMRASNDNQLVKLMHGKKIQKEYFFNPPLEWFALNFTEPKKELTEEEQERLRLKARKPKRELTVEQKYRQDCFKGFKLNPKVTTFASPKFHFLFDFTVLVLTLIFIIISTALVFYQSVPSSLYVMIPFCAVLMLLMLLFQCLKFSPAAFPQLVGRCVKASSNELDVSDTTSDGDPVKSEDNERGLSNGSASGTAKLRLFIKETLFSVWVMTHVCGAIVLCLPMSLVFSAYGDCSERGWKYEMTGDFCMLVSVALLSFISFTQLSAFLKTCLAYVWCIAFVLIILISSGSCIIREQAKDAMMLRDVAMTIMLQMVLVTVLNRVHEKAVRANYYGDKEAAKEKHVAMQQKEVADWLIQDMFPSHVREQLKHKNHCSKNYDMVGVLFATIVNFHEFYEENFEGGIECIRVLHELIADFDKELSKIDGIEKIKTVYGTTFMAASGLNSRPSVHISVEGSPVCHRYYHLKTLVDFALAMQETLNEFNKNMLGFRFRLRCGFNAGPVTAGVIGSIKPQYDIWGDTVNIASRMDSTGVVDHIQVSEECMMRLTDFFTFKERGTIPVKGKGDVKTFLLAGVRLKPPEEILQGGDSQH